MTSCKDVYDAFLSKMLEDEWLNWSDEEMEEDWRMLLNSALPNFKFPRKPLTITGDNFDEDLNNTEIQILATYMKCEWLNRTILSWEHVKPLYEERDFSQANLVDKLSTLLSSERAAARRLESYYYRSIDWKPFDYSKLAGN